MAPVVGAVSSSRDSVGRLPCDVDEIGDGAPGDPPSLLASLGLSHSPSDNEEDAVVEAEVDAAWLVASLCEAPDSDGSLGGDVEVDADSLWADAAMEDSPDSCESGGVLAEFGEGAACELLALGRVGACVGKRPSD